MIQRPPLLSAVREVKNLKRRGWLAWLDGSRRLLCCGVASGEFRTDTGSEPEAEFRFVNSQVTKYQVEKFHRSPCGQKLGSQTLSVIVSSSKPSVAEFRVASKRASVTKQKAAFGD
jgi:hypothetical protein